MRVFAGHPKSSCGFKVSSDRQTGYSIQWTLITIPKDFAIKMNLLLYRILNEQTDM